MKRFFLALVILILSWSPKAWGQIEWLACDSQVDLQGYHVVLNGVDEGIIPYVEIIPAGQSNPVAVIWDVSTLATGDFVIRAVGLQGRESDPIPFSLLPKPLSPTGIGLAVTNGN